MPERQDWSDWDKERRRFTKRDTEGFTKDFAALEGHIKKLVEVCPKDKVGFPVTKALIHIDTLRKFQHNVKNFLPQRVNEFLTHYD